MAANHAIGVDIGGTKIYAGVINLETGHAVTTVRKQTHPDKGTDFFLQRLGDVIEEALDSSKLDRHAGEVLAVGIGLAGQVDREHGIVLGAPNLATGLVNLDLGKQLQDRLSLPVVLGNDVEVAAYGEQMFGSGRDCQNFIYISVGTGIGGAIIRMARYAGALRERRVRSATRWSSIMGVFVAVAGEVTWKLTPLVRLLLA